ncbi:MAG TPA: hypothetical protein VMU31_02920 [Rhizomicrobium sp.]|nr:hypothetical protein [Rhizomicrobium sp.]
MGDEQDMAQSMIRIYGGRAEMVALEHANEFRRRGDGEAYERWLRIIALIRSLSAREGRATLIPGRRCL